MLEANPNPSTTADDIPRLNIWSDEVAVNHFSYWLRNEYCGPGGERGMSEPYASVVLRRVRKLVFGRGIAYFGWPEDVCFQEGIPVDLTHDFHALQAKAKVFQKTLGKDRGHGWILRHPIRMLALYKDHHYSSVLGQRKMVHAFLSTTKHPESSSRVLGDLEVKGIVKLIFAFAVGGYE